MLNVRRVDAQCPASAGELPLLHLEHYTLRTPSPMMSRVGQKLRELATTFRRLCLAFSSGSKKAFTADFIALYESVSIKDKVMANLLGHILTSLYNLVIEDWIADPMGVCIPRTIFHWASWTILHSARVDKTTRRRIESEGSCSARP